MDLFDRIYRLHNILHAARRPVSRATLQRELECKRATVNRIIKEMRLYLNAPIRYDRAHNGYYLAQGDEGPWELPGLWFNASELHALLAAHELLVNVQPGLIGSALAPLRERIEQMLNSRHIGGRDAARRVRVLRMAARDVEGAHFRDVAAAVLSRKRLRIVYHGRERNVTTDREISPQRLVHYRDNWYCDAWDHTKRALRVFSIDRIKECETIDKPAREISDTRLNAHFATAYGIFAGKPRRHAVLRFTAERARWVADENWHPHQRARYLPDGGYQLTVPYTDERELMMDILKYGPDVEVISPASLRRAVRERLSNALARYAREKPQTINTLGATSSTPTTSRKSSRNEPPLLVSFANSSQTGMIKP